MTVSTLLHLSIGILFTLSCVFAHAETPPTDSTNQTIKVLLSEDQQRKAGLHKLTSDELLYLSQWLNKNFIEVSESAPSVAREKLKEIIDAPMHLQISGEFKGWNGKTVFQMTNGEIWQQRVSGSYYKKLESPEVVISKNNLGFYIMEVPEIGKKIGVKLIRSAQR